MNDKVCNPKQTILPDENSFNDRDILNDTLVSLKHLTTMYGTLNTEASNKDLVTIIETLSKNTNTLARDTFNLMFEKGWYKLTREAKNEITTAYDEFKQYYNEITS